MKIINNPRLVMSTEEKMFLTSLAQDLEPYCFGTHCENCQIKSACDKMKEPALEEVLRTLIDLIPIDEDD